MLRCIYDITISNFAKRFLQEISVQNNIIHAMNINALYGLNNLGNLRLDRCLLHRMPYIADVKDTLHTLMVTRNLITHIPDGYFDDMPQIAMLDLANNQLAHFPNVSSVHRTLRTLSLHSNHIPQIPKFVMTTVFIVLEYLRASDNIIKIIPAGFFIVPNCGNLLSQKTNYVRWINQSLKGEMMQ